MSYWRVTPPAIEPIELVTAKNHLRLEIEEDDDLVVGLIAAARTMVEDGLSRSLITTGWRLVLDGFPGTGTGYWPEAPVRWPACRDCPIRLPIADALAITSVTHVDHSGVTQTLDPSAYALAGRAPGYLIPVYGTAWPASRCYSGSVTIDFTAGYGPARSDVPAYLTQALLMAIAQLYENRDGTAIDRLMDAPIGVRSLCTLADWGATG